MGRERKAYTDSVSQVNRKKYQLKLDPKSQHRQVTDQKTKSGNLNTSFNTQKRTGHYLDKPRQKSPPLVKKKTTKKDKKEEVKKPPYTTRTRTGHQMDEIVRQGTE